MEPIILASGSPRRKELLEQIGIDFEVIPSKKEEIITCKEPWDVVQELAGQKAEDIVLSVNQPGKLVVGADTIVTFRQQIMGKPKSEKEAYEMISGLQGNVHQVYTGVAISYLGQDGKLHTKTFYEVTDVHVYPMSHEEIKSYITAKEISHQSERISGQEKEAKIECMDKAGAYGIQGRFAAYISHIHGDYNNVVGLPIGRLYQELKQLAKIGNR